MKIPPYTYAGLDRNRKLPLETEGKIKVILDLTRDFYSKKSVKTSTRGSKEDYVGLLLAKNLLEFSNYNSIARKVESTNGFPKRSATLLSLKAWDNTLQVDKNLAKEYEELKELITVKLKLNNNQ